MELSNPTRRPVSLAAAGLISTFMMAAAAQASAAEVLRFYDGGWENIQINNAITMYIVEHGFGVDVESVASDAPRMQQQMLADEIDVNLEMWSSLMPRWVEEQLDAGAIVKLGPIYERATQGFYVPTYLIEGDPDLGIAPVAPELETAEDLAGYADILRAAADGDKGEWLNCITGWACRVPNRIKMSTYGLDADFEAVELSSEAELNAAILSSYEARRPFITYYWDPSPMLGMIDLTLLEEPPYSDSCWQAIETALADYQPGDASEMACAYETVSINKYVTAAVIDRMPQITAFLANIFVGTERVRELAGYMTRMKVTPEETAIYFLRTRPDEWQPWVPDAVAERVRAALSEAQR